MDCRRAKEEDGEMGVFSKYRYHIARLFYFGNSLRESGHFFQTKGGCKDGFWHAFY